MMDLPTALRLVGRGSEIRREIWEDPTIYVDITEGILSIHNDSSSADAWIISTDDLMSEDWILFENIEEDEISED